MKKNLKLFCIALAILMIAAIVVKGVDTSWGAVSVKRASEVSPNGYLMNYKLYIPKSATPENPAPALVYMVGGGASLDESSMIAVEASRRGYIVMVTDVPGNGMSEPIISTAGGFSGSTSAVPINSMSEGLAYTARSAEIVKSLNMTDKSQLVFGGHSMGGYYTSVMAQQYADEIKACLALGTYGFSGKLENATNFNYALIVGEGDESVLSRTTGYRTLTDATQSPALKQMFGVREEEEIESGKVYGSYEDQTARVLYTPNTMHMLEPDNAGVAKLFLTELEKSTVAPKSIPASNLVYWVKDVAMLVAFADFTLLLFALVQMLLETSMFSGLVLKRENRYVGYKPKTKGWYVATVVLVLLCGCLYILGYMYYSQLPIVSKLGNAGGKSTWSLFTGILLAAYVVVFHMTMGKKNGASAADYGLATSDSGKFSIVYILKSLVFALTTFAVVYGLFCAYFTYTGCNIHVVWFNSEMLPLEPTKVRYKFIQILLFMFAFIFTNSIAQKTISGYQNNVVKEYVQTSLVGTAGMLVTFVAFVGALLIPHVCLFAANRGCFGAETLLGVAASFWMINLSCYYLNKKTNSIWTGTITASVIMTWLCIFATGMNF